MLYSNINIYLRHSEKSLQFLAVDKMTKTKHYKNSPTQSALHYVLKIQIAFKYWS